MRNKILTTVLLALCCAGVSAQSAHTTGEYRKGEVIVKFKKTDAPVLSAKSQYSQPSSKELDNVMKKMGAGNLTQLMPLSSTLSQSKQILFAKGQGGTASIENDDDLRNLYLLQISDEMDVKEAVKELQELSEIEFAEPNYIVKSLKNNHDDWMAEPLYSQQWGLGAANVPAFWSATAGKPNVLGRRPVIAILDTGVDITHEDLKANIWTNTKETDDDGLDNDNNGYKDDIHGWDFINQTGVMGDYNGHGTHCAGIAAAVGNNGVGIAGANPEALIMPVAVLQSNGQGDIATIIKGIDYAVANGADVISMSLGGYDYSIAEYQALSKAYSKCVIVAAAGNDGHTLERSLHCPACSSGGMPMYPAAFNFVIGVQASSNGGGLASFSNWDNNGPIYTTYNEEKLYNYEVTAPGTSIMSTYPGGRYKNLQGTSMACPLVAGIVSRLLQTKEYNSWEILMGDLIHTSNNGVIDALEAYNMTDARRKPSLECVALDIVDETGDNDGRVDAGETLVIYPTLRNAWGTASNVVMTLEMADNEDATLAEFIDNDVEFGTTLSSYAKAKSLNPLRIKLRDEIVDGRVVKMVLKAHCDNIMEDLEFPFEFKVENGVELGGTQRENITLEPGVQYIVTRNWGIPKDVVVTVKPGTTIKIKDGVGISNYGNMLFEGTKDAMITITKGDNDLGNIGNFLNDNAKVVDFTYVVFDNLTNIDFANHRYNNCVIRNCNVAEYLTRGATFRGCDIYNNKVVGTIAYLSNGSTFIETNVHSNVFEGSLIAGFGSAARFYHSNYIGNEIVSPLAVPSTPLPKEMEESNCYGNFYESPTLPKNDYYSIIFNTTEPEIFYLSKTYLGTASADVAYSQILDTEDNMGWGTVDVTQMEDIAVPDAPVCVDQILFDGIDPQDQADEMLPVGVGQHEVTVYFNRQMDMTVDPVVTMGVRPPYTQKSISENGYWDDPFTYITHITIDGKSATDGLNRIRVYGYKEKDQNPEFENPDEHYRYNVLVSAAGSMSTGLMAEEGLGKVSLTWETDEADYEDLLGYNIYRYTRDEEGVNSDACLVNKQMIDSDETQYVDYDVVPGTTYYYYIKELGTSLTENSISATVAATPQTAKKGDANGSLNVDIADVMAEVAYLSNENPQPFIFEAADVNNDSEVNILDVVGTLRIIVNEASSSAIEDEETAYCYVKDGELMVESPVAIGGVQVMLNADADSEVVPSDGLQGMEKLNAQATADTRLFLSYSMSGKVLAAGKQTLLNMDSDVTVGKVILSTPKGANIKVEMGDATGIADMEDNGKKSAGMKGMYDITGRKLTSMPKHGLIILNGKKKAI